MSNLEKVQTGLYTYMRGLSRKRSKKTITADDAHVYLTKKGIGEQKVRTRLSLINSVLRRPDFRPVGTVSSKREPARYRKITEWRYARRK